MNMRLIGAFTLAGTLLMPIVIYAADMSTDSTGEYIDDAAITTKIKAKFAMDKQTQGRDISVRTDHGVVDLVGTVNSKNESDRATELASQIKGVTAVHNNLKVSSND